MRGGEELRRRSLLSHKGRGNDVFNDFILFPGLFFIVIALHQSSQTIPRLRIIISSSTTLLFSLSFLFCTWTHCQFICIQFNFSFGYLHSSAGSPSFSHHRSIYLLMCILVDRVRSNVKKYCVVICLENSVEKRWTGRVASRDNNDRDNLQRT